MLTLPYFSQTFSDVYSPVVFKMGKGACYLCMLIYNFFQEKQTKKLHVIVKTFITNSQCVQPVSKNRIIII